MKFLITYVTPQSAVLPPRDPSIELFGFPYNDYMYFYHHLGNWAMPQGIQAIRQANEPKSNWKNQIEQGVIIPFKEQYEIFTRSSTNETI